MVNNANQNSEIDDIVAELKAGAVPTNSALNDPIQLPKVNDENVGTYIYDRSVEIIEMSLASIRSMQNLIATAADPKEIAAYANLIAVASKTIDNLNKINLQQKQALNNIEVKKIEAEARSKNPLLAQPNGPQTNNIFIGSPDEARKMLTKSSKKIQLEDSQIVEIEE